MREIELDHPSETMQEAKRLQCNVGIKDRSRLHLNVYLSTPCYVKVWLDLSSHRGCVSCIRLLGPCVIKVGQRPQQVTNLVNLCNAWHGGEVLLADSCMAQMWSHVLGFGDSRRLVWSRIVVCNRRQQLEIMAKVCVVVGPCVTPTFPEPFIVLMQRVVVILYGGTPLVVTKHWQSLWTTNRSHYGLNHSRGDDKGRQRGRGPPLVIKTTGDPQQSLVTSPNANNIPLWLSCTGE